MHIYGFMCLCIRNCLPNARFSVLYAIDAKYRFYITFPNSFRNIESLSTQRFYIFFVLFFGGGGGYYTHFEPSQSLDVAKTGDPQNKPPGHS